MFRAILVANRGAVAARIIRACRTLSVRSVAVYSDADADLPYLAEADEAHRIGPGPAKDSYLHADRLLALAAEREVDALHPGYGFLAEDAGFARRVQAAGITFIGPEPSLIVSMGEKTRARARMAAAGLPVTRGSPLLASDASEAERAAAAIGYPVLVKPANGGGGIGI